jgi:hypothetical protein
MKDSKNLYDTLKIDLDAKSKSLAIKQICDRLSYMHDLKFLNISGIDKVFLITKTNTSVKIKFKRKCLNVNSLVIMQLLLGSDYRKEINTLINFHYLRMQYFNRMFDVKRYKDGTIIEAKIEDVTDKVIKYILNEKRKKYRN